ncbi:MAG: GNAT family N-acetyltransferase [Pseudomonadaceae bacterium]|nr:GNAT family N-acetyltransferase [Pseudomonadaceae bacterium]
MTIRRATAADLPAITDIYNHYVEHDHATFDTRRFTATEREAWLQQFDEQRRVCLVDEHNGSIRGYACSGQFKAKRAYDTSVEVSVYLSPDCAGQGIGRSLYEILMPHLDTHGVHRAYAGIALPNAASIALHSRFEFRQIARLAEVGFKFGRYWDVVWMERNCAG